MESLNALYQEGMSLLPCIRDRKKQRPEDFSQILSDPECYGKCINTVLCYEEDGQVAGFACCLVIPDEEGTNHVEIRHLVFERESADADTLYEAVSLLESAVSGDSAFLMIRFSGLYEKAFAFWQRAGYIRSEPLLFIDDDVQIVMVKEVEQGMSAMMPIASAM